MLERLLQAVINTAILVLFAVCLSLIYILIVGNFFFEIDGIGYAMDAPAQIRLSALLLIFSISVVIRLLWRGRRRTSK